MPTRCTGFGSGGAGQGEAGRPEGGTGRLMHGHTAASGDAATVPHPTVGALHHGCRATGLGAASG